MSVNNIVAQQTLELKGQHGLVLLVTRCRVADNQESVTITIPSPANTGSGTQPGSKGTNRTTAVSVAALLDHRQVESEVELETSGTSTIPTLNLQSNSTNNRDTDVVVTSGSSTALRSGDTFTLVSLHRLEDLNFVDQKFQ